MNDDTTLLRRYAQEGDESAFTELVQRHVNLVWGAACRITQDPDLAKDVSQTVFADLARKATKLPSHTIVAGWLYRSATLAAQTAVRTNSRRARREELAMMQSPPSQDANSNAGQVLQPYVDQALDALPEADRDAVLLRYFSGLNFTQIGDATGTSDDAAQKRVSRALDKLRHHFVQRGIDLSQGAVAAGLSLAAAQAAPPEIATLFAAKAIATATSGTLIASLTAMKTSFIVAGATAAIVVSSGFAAWEYSLVRSLRADNAALNNQIIALAQRPPGLIPAPPKSGGAKSGLAGLPTGMAEVRETLEKDLISRLTESQAAIVPGAMTAEERDSHNRTVADLARLGREARAYALDHQERFPTVQEASKEGVKFTTTTILPQGTPVAKFELFPQPRAITLHEPELFILREITPVHLADGHWLRTYCYVDGTVKTKAMPSADFSEFEWEGTADDEAPAAQPVDGAPTLAMDPVLMQRYGLSTTAQYSQQKKSPSRKKAPGAMDPALARRYGLVPQGGQTEISTDDAKRAMESRYGLAPGSLNPATASPDNKASDPAARP
ncbi:MAG TPA: RNA polymerase sigma factor [Candidatus Limnocylindria bacterium]|jgi:RNA polymerase sigma factor (sigma-70 family)|nr:RNA polymerase sigma factor [Candidatus Limnocylindria bacterium]